MTSSHSDAASASKLAGDEESHDSDIISEDLTTELLLRDDWQWVEPWNMFFDNVCYIPAGSQAEGGYLARNARHYREPEFEEDRMMVIGWLLSPGGGVVEDVGAEHVHLRYPHDNLRVRGKWEEEVESTLNSNNGGATGAPRAINGRQLVHGYSPKVIGGDEHVQGPSVAATRRALQHDEHQGLDASIAEWGGVIQRYEAMQQQGAEGIVDIPELGRHARRMAQWITEKKGNARYYRFKIVCKGLVASLESMADKCSQLGEGSNHGDSCTELVVRTVSHIRRAHSIMKMWRSNHSTESRSIDAVLVIEGMFWPQQAQAWRHRERRWPSEEVVQRVVRQGFHLVSKPRRTTDDLPASVTDYDWRVSFALSEQIIARSRTLRQKKAYYIFKIVYYKYLKGIEVGGESLRSYACKTVMLWVSEMHDVSWWDDNTTLCTVTTLLRYLQDTLVKRCLRSYFIDGVNLFDGWNMPEEVVERCISVLGEILEEPRRYLVSDMDVVVHQLLGRYSGNAERNVSKIVEHLVDVEDGVHKLKALYVRIADKVIIASHCPSSWHGGTTNEILSTLRNIDGNKPPDKQNQSGGPFTNFIHKCRNLAGKLMANGRAESDKGIPLTDGIRDEFGKALYERWRRYPYGLLSSLYRLMSDVDGMCKKDEYSGGMSRLARRLVSVVCEPHVLLDARVLCRADHSASTDHYKTLTDTRLIQHVISTIHGLTHATEVIKQMWAMNTRPTDKLASGIHYDVIV